MYGVGALRRTGAGNGAGPFAADYGHTFTAALTTIVTRARHVNVLPAAACRNVAAAILHYQRGDDRLAVPLRLIEHYARVHDHATYAIR